MPVKASDLKARGVDQRIRYDEEEYRRWMAGGPAPRPIPVEEDRQKPAKPARPSRRPAGGGGPRWRGCIPGSAMAIAVIVGIPVVAVALVLLSFLGTFYGVRGLPVPILAPWRIPGDLGAAPWVLGVAVILQGGLSLAQWGGRQLAKSDRRWWVLYGLALALSVWYNWIGYGPALIALGVPWLLAGLGIILGDVIPELAIIRE